ncbi:hypothetical protein SPD48_01520 [Pseudogracilibacillus sp. SE30717A]|uniref:hypothetical protein n=1 Tax=Pseudogracilibacillus sp. SE30717A TaxID=3098293 RepID=UPI00300E3037
MKNYLVLVFMWVLLLPACGKSNDPTQFIYETNFSGHSPRVEQFIKDYITSDVTYHLVTKDNVNVYAKKNLGSQQKTIEYIQFNDEQLKQYYEHILDAESPKTEIEKLRESKESLFQSVDDKDAYHLPEINLEEGNIFYIKTSISEKSFKLPDLLKEYDVDVNDKVMFNIVAVDKESFQIDIQVKQEDGSSKENMSVFITQDLQNTFVSETYTDEFLNNIVKGNLNPYENLFVKLDSEGRYIKAANSFGVADTVKNELKWINELDYLSQDNQYVYLGGNADPLSEGKQRIQEIEEYLVGNEEYFAEFDLNLKQISDALELNSVNDVSIGKVKYFNEDFIILYLNFKAAITGTAGSTNVIIDFQEDRENPTIYLVDLGLH